ncbi:MAG: ABC transporter permease [Bacteroidales bacterium]|nr:ABC transporter permease [Bacteroidales bacterium]
MNFNVISESLSIAWRSIRSHLLRTVLTVLIIAFGIMALISILTAIESIKYSLSSNFTRMGSNTFTISEFRMQRNGGGPGKKVEFDPISWDDASEFQQRYEFPAQVSIFTQATGTATLKYRQEKTNPNISVIGGDDYYLNTSGQNISLGRNFSVQDVSLGRSVCIIGADVKDKLFPGGKNPVGEQINIGPQKFRIIGVLESQGSSFGFSSGNSCIVPVTCLRRFFGQMSISFDINIMPSEAKFMDAAISEATGLMRSVRKLELTQENNFDIRQSNSLVTILLDNIRYITLAATLIGLITLLGASIGLMNIMLVSVSERTREIGVRKALGANNIAIRNQFLIESILIGQLGGFLGIILGVLAGNILSVVLKSSFIIPWGWIILGFMLTLIVGVLSGLLPAIRASRLDPIESLRHE